MRRPGDLFVPYRLVDGDGVVVVPAAAFFAELAACGRPATTQRSYGMDLLRWFRFLWAVGVGWDQATRVEARDFCRWLQVDGQAGAAALAVSRLAALRDRVRRPAAATANAVTGKPSRGGRYEAATVAHCESVLRGFYDFHLEAGTGPMVNPFPLARHRRPGRANAHHNPMEPFGGQRSGRYRPKVVARAPRCIPDERFDALFAAAGLAPGPGAGRVLGVDRGAGLGAAGRHGRRCRPGPAADHGDPQGDPGVAAAAGRRRMRSCGCGFIRRSCPGWCPAGRDEPLWWTLRRPFRALTYDAARAMFTRANAALGVELVAARSAPHGGLSDGPGSADAADRRAVGAGARAPVDHAALPEPGDRGRDRRGARLPRPAAATATRRRRRRRDTGPRACRSCSARTQP